MFILERCQAECLAVYHQLDQQWCQAECPAVYHQLCQAEYQAEYQAECQEECHRRLHLECQWEGHQVLFQPDALLFKSHKVGRLLQCRKVDRPWLHLRNQQLLQHLHCLRVVFHQVGRWNSGNIMAISG